MEDDAPVHSYAMSEMESWNHRPVSGSALDPPGEPNVYDAFDDIDLECDIADFNLFDEGDEDASCHTSGSSEDDDENDLVRHMDFLHQKQRLLQRASRFLAAECAYNAAHARVEALGAAAVSAEPPLWQQARDYLAMHALDEPTLEDECQVERTTEPPLIWDPTTSSYHDRSDVTQPHRTVKIDISTVRHVTSNHFPDPPARRLIRYKG